LLRTVGGLAGTAATAGLVWWATTEKSESEQDWFWLVTGAAVLGVAFMLIYLYVGRLQTSRENLAPQDRLLAEADHGQTEGLEWLVEMKEHTGLVDYQSKLKVSSWHPSHTLPHIQLSLHFIGHGASKWTKEDDLMREMLYKLSKRVGARVRIMLLNPNCERKLDEQKKIVKSLCRLRSLMNEYGEASELLRIKTYEHEPHFRITLIDRKLAVVGHYLGSEADSSESPLVLWGMTNAQWTFYRPFELLFEREWDDEDAKEPNWAEIAKLAEKLGVPFPDGPGPDA
jgi:hypothetical protein